jgi:hypothetical protein
MAYLRPLSIFPLGRVSPPGCISPNMASDLFRHPWHLHWTRVSRGCPCQGLPWNNLPAGMDLPVAIEKSRGFRQELRLRVSRAKCGEPFRALCNATDDLRTCVQCGKMAPKMMHCAGCKWARYCDRVCQKANWRTHRTECCPDHSLPTGIRTIPYPYEDAVCLSCQNIGRRLATLTPPHLYIGDCLYTAEREQNGVLRRQFVHRRAREERCAAMIRYQL